MDPKSCQESINACSGGVSKRDFEEVPSPGSGKVRSGCYLLHFSKVGGLKKKVFWIPFWDRLGDKIVEIGFQIGSKKIVEIYIQNS